jgi:hypothetical protein
MCALPAPAWQSIGSGASRATSATAVTGGSASAIGMRPNIPDSKPFHAPSAFAAECIGGWGEQDTDDDIPQSMQVKLAWSVCQLSRIRHLRALQRQEVFANSKISGVHFESSRGSWMQVLLTCNVCRVFAPDCALQERAAPTFGNSSLQGTTSSALQYAFVFAC